MKKRTLILILSVLLCTALKVPSAPLNDAGADITEIKFSNGQHDFSSSYTDVSPCYEESRQPDTLK